MEDLAASSSSSSSSSASRHGGNDDPSASESTDFRPPITAALPIRHHICRLFTFLVSPLFCIFNCFRRPRPRPAEIPVQQAMDETSPPLCPPMSRDNQNATVPYKVFINRPGIDVRKTIASIIHYSLKSRGFQVFYDTEEWQTGQQLNPVIEDAIRTSSVHIVVFSKRFAELEWCLKDLCLLLETQVRIIPVFYDVRPSDLRRIEKGAYASAFAGHAEEGRFDLKTISEWKEALRRVSYFAGFDLRDKTTLDGDEGELLRSVEQILVQYLKWPVPLDVARDAVGLGESIQDFEAFMERGQQSGGHEKAKIVGIVGRSGSGKTTLAQGFYNKRRSSFNGSSFLFDVRDHAAKNRLQKLQSKFLDDLFPGKSCKIESISEGKGIIKDRLQSWTPSVLVILDDIDHPDQVEALLVNDVFGPGSLVIITSRDERALQLSEASLIYQIKQLRPDQEQTLFYSYAFKQPPTAIGFENLVEKFCDKCDGLPLLLKLMASHLHVLADRDMDQWEDELEHMQDGMQGVLDASYDTLHTEEQQIFLDIACFFVGEDKHLAIKVWDASGAKGLRRLKNLENKCLIEVDKGNRLKMHDHIREFGRELADREPPYRVWNEDQANHLRQMAITEYRGIMAGTTSHEYNLDRGSGNKFDWWLDCRSSYQPPLEQIELSALKFLVMKGDCSDERIGRRAENLVWLRWFEGPHTNISPWLAPMRNLTVLELVGGNLEEWPLGDEQVRLRHLKIEGTKLSHISIPEGVCPDLEHLDLCRNECLTEVKDLPAKLVKLNLSYCRALKRISGNLSLEKLQELSIRECSDLLELPNLRHWSSLEELDARGCIKLQNMQGLEHLRKLRCLTIEECSGLIELPDLQRLGRLETLLASGCRKLQKIRGLEHLRKLQTLRVVRCSELHELANLARLISLKEVKADGCWKLRSIQGLDQLQNLQEFTLSADNSRAISESIKRFKKLPAASCFTTRARGRARAEINSRNFRDLPVIGLSTSYRGGNCVEMRCSRAPVAVENSWSTAMICLVVHSSSSTVAPLGDVTIRVDVGTKWEWRCDSVAVKGGEWLCILILSSISHSLLINQLHLNTACFRVSLASPRMNVNTGEFQIRKGWLVMGFETEEHTTRMLQVVQDLQ